MKNNGKPAERAFEDYWLGRGAHVERLRDKADLVGLNKTAKIADFKKPSDFLVSGHDVLLHYAEVKSTSNPRLFPFGQIEDGQSKAAILEAHRGAGSYIFYIWSVSRGKWFIMNARKYVDALNAGRRSVKFEELEEWQK